jgi:hypothetical protein
MPASETLETVDTVTFFMISTPSEAGISKENHDIRRRDKRWRQGLAHPFAAMAVICHMFAAPSY